VRRRFETSRRGHTDYVLNDAAYGYMRKHASFAPLIASLPAHPATRFADLAAWQAHLGRVGFAAPDVTPDPVPAATEGALWGSSQSHEFLRDVGILSDDAVPFKVGHHALCWLHAKRLVHKPDTLTDEHRAAQTRVRGLIWDFYADLKAYRLKPVPGRPAALRTRFDRSLIRFPAQAVAPASSRRTDF